MELTTEQVLRMVRAERQRQNAKWGQQVHDPEVWITILAEEVGELASDTLRARARGCPAPDMIAMITEATHVAAVAVAMIEDMATGFDGSPEELLPAEGTTQ